jgi:phosphoglycerate dehydrogenase-like enzyme
MMKIAIEPSGRSEFESAVVAADCEVAPLTPEVKALVWTDYSRPELLRQTLDANPQLEWVQLPFAGVDAFADLLTRHPVFTSAKAAYSEPVAEHALALMLALGRAIPERVRAKSWGEKFAVSLYESKVLVVGAGGIAQELVKLLEPFGTEVVLCRRGEHEKLLKELPAANFVVLACALTDETRNLFDREMLGRMRADAYLVNVARGGVVVTEDLVEALNNGVIAGAGVDVTMPEPLPDGHPLWEAKNCIITPHTADTEKQVVRLFAERIEVNAKAYAAGSDFIGVVDKELGY